MSATLLNWLVVVAYFAATLWLGERLGRGQATVDDYFLAGRRMRWPLACLSIVGTETSTLTFVGVPALAYAGDLTFLQVAVGYVIGRFVVAALLVPAYFEGRIQTAYELLADRYGGRVRSFASLVFLISRCLADGVRLFATALVLQAMLPMSLPLAVVLVTGVTLIYTLRGGLKAVIWNDSAQLLVYLAGALLALSLLLRKMPGGWAGAESLLRSEGKLRVLDFGWDWSQPYLIWAGLLGGAVLTMATHGTDQMFVQRLLACGSPRAAQKAVVASGGLVLAQMALFLVIGALLFVYYDVHPPAHPFTSGDQVFARFIAEELPAGLGGFVIAAVFAAAMSTLSSSMSSLASASMVDFVLLRRPRPAVRALRASRRATLVWAVALAAVASLARAWGSVLEAGLTITSITFGAVLGIFLISAWGWRLHQRAALTAMAIGLGAAVVAHLTPLAWTWLTPVGTLATLAAGAAFGGMARLDARRSPARDRPSDEVLDRAAGTSER